MINFLKKHRNLVIKVIVLFVIFQIFTSISLNVIYGLTNTVYSPNDGSTIEITKKQAKSKLFTLLGKFVYLICNFIERVVAKIFGEITGIKVFPWADNIIFNVIPFLDINFISPANGSLFLNTNGTSSEIGKIVRTIYYIIYYLSITFLGVAVGVMAIKVAFSSISNDKAKAKKALLKLVVSFILVFTVHYLIAFIFYLNERIVEVASSILIDALNKNETLDYKFDDNKIRILVETNENNKYFVLFNVSSKEFYTEEINDDSKINEYEKDLEEYNGTIVDWKKEYLDWSLQLINLLINEYGVENIEDLSDDKTWLTTVFVEKFGASANENDIEKARLLGDYFIKATSEEIIKEYINSQSQSKRYCENIATFLKASVYKYTDLKTTSMTASGDIQTASGEVVTEGNNFRPVNAFIYSIFIFQSLMYLTSYAKRIFYVIVLAMFAPLVIIYDFAMG